MKKMLLIGVFAMLATAMLGVTAADARGNHQDRHRPNQYNQHNQQNYKLKDDARFVLQRTANVLQQAQNEARNDRDSRGRRQHRQRMNGNNKFKGLGFAISLQAEACDLYQQEDIKKPSIIPYALGLSLYGSSTMLKTRGEAGKTIMSFKNAISTETRWTAGKGDTGIGVRAGRCRFTGGKSPMTLPSIFGFSSTSKNPGSFNPDRINTLSNSGRVFYLMRL